MSSALDPQHARQLWTANVQYKAFNRPFTPSALQYHLHDLMQLFAIAKYTQGDTDNDDFTDANVDADTAHLTRLFTIQHLNYSSPLGITLAWSGAATTCIASARGLLYIWSQWLDLRVKHHETALKVEQVKMLRNALPSLDDNPRPIDTPDAQDQFDEIVALRRRVSAAAATLEAIDQLDFSFPDPSRGEESSSGQGDASSSSPPRRSNAA